MIEDVREKDLTSDLLTIPVFGSQLDLNTIVVAMAIKISTDPYQSHVRGC
jgi:hypothetical protein